MFGFQFVVLLLFQIRQHTQTGYKGHGEGAVLL